MCLHTLFRSSDSSLSTDYRWLLTTNKPHLAGKKAEVLNLNLVKGLQRHSNRSNQLLFLEKQAFSKEFSHTLELKYKVLNAVVSE